MLMETEYITIADLLKEAHNIFEYVVPWHGKKFVVKWQELEEDERPSVEKHVREAGDISGNRDKLIKLATAVQLDTVWAMIEKGQKTWIKENPEFVPITREQFDELPPRIREMIVGHISGSMESISQNF